jgi:hypothetical protein
MRTASKSYARLNKYQGVVSMECMTGREVSNVKGIMILALLFAAGCSAYVPLEQLEAEALVTGDWSKVEERQRMITRRNLRSSIACPPGTIGYCEVEIGGQHCSCVENEVISSFLQR